MSIYHSPAIQSIHRALGNQRQNRILDLGSTSCGTFNFFSRISCKIHFENLDRFVAENRRLSIGNLIYKLQRYLLGHGSGETFDVILTWDLFNYLPVDAVAALLRQLQQHCKPGTLVHSIKYLSADIPRTPRSFSIRDEGQLVWCKVLNAVISGPLSGQMQGAFAQA